MRSPAEKCRYTDVDGTRCCTGVPNLVGLAYKHLLTRAGTPTWLVIVIVLACLGSVGLAGFVVYRLRLRSAMHQEIRAIMVRLQCCAGHAYFALTL